MRVISMVPSWTETLLECGVKVVGRTRFCSHPEKAVDNIPIVGGTKDIRWGIVKSLNADLLILDKEENPITMSEQTIIPTFSTHVESMNSMPGELLQLADKLNQKKLKLLGERWQKIIDKPDKEFDSKKIPGFIDWIQAPKKEVNDFKQFIYIIWQNPWMAVSKNTFIGSVFQKCGWGDRMWSENDKYPRFDFNKLDLTDTLLLFSSEPYNFANKVSEIRSIPAASALVDGQELSWFGLRSLVYLEEFL